MFGFRLEALINSFCMISEKEFIDGVTSQVLNGIPPNGRQEECIKFPLSPDLMIIAGPGSGKTTVLVLRALKHVIVDPPSTQGEAVETTKVLIDRLVQDCVDMNLYGGGAGKYAKARKLIAQSMTDLHAFMRAKGQFDFALLEAEFLNKLGYHNLRDKLDPPRVLLIDEYQDTNPLQEAIYFRLAKDFRTSVTIVGDDDQSLYRFRGATVELFRDFQDRFSQFCNRAKPTARFLVDNYRSTSSIVTFCNRFVVNDPNFAPARVTPPKPAIIASGANQTKQVPVLGIFRPSIDQLATDLSKFLLDVFRNGGKKLPGTSTVLRCEPNQGDFADAVFMAHSVNEFGRAMFGNPPKARLPWLLRQELEAKGIPVFNPRGRALKDIPEVRILLGLISLCIDTSCALLDGMVTFVQTKQEIKGWRNDAEAFIQTNPIPAAPHGLRAFVNAWQAERPQSKGMKGDWPKEWPILDLLYKLITWLPQFQTLPEYQVYLEAIARSVTQALAFSPYQGSVIKDGPHHNRSRESVLRDILSPIAQDVVEVDEELLVHVPRNHLNFMTIHQSKGLEFPLVIVDIGSDFSRNHPKQRFRRFPDGPSNVTQMEDDLAPYSNVGALRTRRKSLDRTFEDLIRLYYVAYSRPQTAIVLVGNTNLLRYDTKICNVATFWQQKGTWPWQQSTPPVSGKKSPASVSGMGITEI
jgi:DNA helicase II / ATP-dependent DNA helicase PcrA